MPQPVTIEPREFKLRSSRVQRRTSVLLIAVLLGLGVLTFPGLVLLPWSVMLLFAGWRLDCHLRQYHDVVLRFDSEGWSFCDAAGHGVPVQWLPATAVLSLAVVLRWREGWRWYGLLITPDMLGEADYRRLCRLLWQSPAAQSVPSAL